MIPRTIEQLGEELVTEPFFGEAVKFVLDKLGDVRNRVIVDSDGFMDVFLASREQGQSEWIERLAKI
jgi:hypothetical protein